MAKKKSNQKINKWVKVLLWVLGVLIGLGLVSVICFKIWVSTWQEYRSDEFGFSLRVPEGWNIQDPRNNQSSEQYVYDYGSVLKAGDGSLEFSQQSDGSYKYGGNLLIYIYNDIPEKCLGLRLIKIGSDGVSKDYIYSNGEKSFMISVIGHDLDNQFMKMMSNLILRTVVGSFKILGV